MQLKHQLGFVINTIEKLTHVYVITLVPLSFGNTVDVVAERTFDALRIAG